MESLVRGVSFSFFLLFLSLRVFLPWRLFDGIGRFTQTLSNGDKFISSTFESGKGLRKDSVAEEKEGDGESSITKTGSVSRREDHRAYTVDLTVSWLSVKMLLGCFFAMAL